MVLSCQNPATQKQTAVLDSYVQTSTKKSYSPRTWCVGPPCLKAGTEQCLQVKFLDFSPANPKYVEKFSSSTYNLILTQSQCFLFLNIPPCTESSPITVLCSSQHLPLNSKVVVLLLQYFSLAQQTQLSFMLFLICRRLLSLSLSFPRCYKCNPVPSQPKKTKSREELKITLF